MKKLEFRLKLGTGADWEALGPIPEPFPFIIDADCTTLAFKHYLSHKILNGVFEPGSFQLRLQGCDKELEDVADASRPTTSTHRPQLRRLASQGVCNGSVLQLDVCATEEELQRYLDAAEECGAANELRQVEEQQEAQTPLRHAAAGVDPRQGHAAEGGAAAAAGDGPTGRPSLGMMHTPAGTVGTFLDDEDADYLQEDLEALVQQAAQRAGEEELDDLNVAADGEPFEAEEAEDFEAHGGELRGAGGGVGAPQQQHPAFAAAAEGREQEGDGEDWGDLGLRSAGTRAAGQPERRAAVATPARKQQQQQQRPRANLQSAAKRARREAPEGELDFVSGSEDEGAQPARQQQRTHGAAVGGSTRRAAAPARTAATGAATAAGAAAPRSQPPRQPALARSTGLPAAAMQPAVDTGAFSAYGGGGGQQRASSGFWSLEETERLVEWVDSHGARQWTMFVQLNTDLHRDVEQVKMKWRNLKNASKKRWTVARRVPPPDLRARIDEIVRRDT